MTIEWSIIREQTIRKLTETTNPNTNNKFTEKEMVSQAARVFWYKYGVTPNQAEELMRIGKWNPKERMIKSS